jgi:hypothetical protein
VIKEITEPSGWYWLDGKFYIISDVPGAEEKRKAHPEIEALPLAELERMTAESASFEKPVNEQRRPE